MSPGCTSVCMKTAHVYLGFALKIRPMGLYTTNEGILLLFYPETSEACFYSIGCLSHSWSDYEWVNCRKPFTQTLVTTASRLHSPSSICAIYCPEPQATDVGLHKGSYGMGWSTPLLPVVVVLIRLYRGARGNH